MLMLPTAPGAIGTAGEGPSAGSSPAFRFLLSSLCCWFLEVGTVVPAI